MRRLHVKTVNLGDHSWDRGLFPATTGYINCAKPFYTVDSNTIKYNFDLLTQLKGECVQCAFIKHDAFKQFACLSVNFLFIDNGKFGKNRCFVTKQVHGVTDMLLLCPCVFKICDKTCSFHINTLTSGFNQTLLWFICRVPFSYKRSLYRMVTRKLNPVNLYCDQHLISPWNSSARFGVKVMRILEQREKPMYGSAIQ